MKQDVIDQRQRELRRCVAQDGVETT